MDAADRTDPAFTALAEVIIDIAREIQLRAAEHTPVVPLTPTQGQVMRYVHRHPGCSASDIADGAGLQRTNVSTALRELRARGYLTSLRDEQDGRAIRISATRLSDDTISKLTDSWAGLLESAWTSAPAVGDATTLAVVAVALEGVRDRLSADRSADRATKGFLSATPAEADDGEDSSGQI
jgi:DNA-binding MarR family transcriptional regulator